MRASGLRVGSLTSVSAATIVHDWEPSANRHGERSVCVQDETLREGLQNASVQELDVECKVELLHRMAELRIEHASLGMPCAGPHQFESAVRLCREIDQASLPIVPNCGGRTVVGDVAAIVDVAQRTGSKTDAFLFVGSSPVRQLVEGWSLRQLCGFVEEAVGFATKHGLPVTFITEDTTRSSPEHLAVLFKTAVEAGTERICLCDTVGIATPASTQRLVAWTREWLRSQNVSVGIDWHGHDDRGLAIANTLAAMDAGAGRLHATALGLGERVGNAAMETLLVNLRLLGVRTHDLSALGNYAALVAQAAGISIDAAAPVVGENAFRTACGVHAAAIQKAREHGLDELAERVYSGIPPRWVGRRTRIDLGPLSGDANVRSVLQEMGVELDRDGRKALLNAAKSKARLLTHEEIRAFLSERASSHETAE